MSRRSKLHTKIVVIQEIKDWVFPYPPIAAGFALTRDAVDIVLFYLLI